mmetsp:Transcript_62710/g.149699  ORF Transcript_62710/g.149699 Transcript_62710/m.149699 type:complete len:124 (+) Transcript_62710:100-471(+)
MKCAMSLLVATAAVMSQASADNFLQPRQLQAPEVDVDCHEITYAQCVGNLFQQSDAMKECCQGKVEKSWVEVRDGMPWWGWPLLALGLVVLCACCVSCFAKLGAELCCWIFCCPCRCLCGRSK